MEMKFVFVWKKKICGKKIENQFCKNNTMKKINIVVVWKLNSTGKKNSFKVIVGKFLWELERQETSTWSKKTQTWEISLEGVNWM